MTDESRPPEKGDEPPQPEHPTDPDSETMGLEPEEAPPTSPGDEGATVDLPASGGSAKGPDVPQMTFRIPERIGQYRIRAIIGSGGMGTVYEAMQETPRRKVALKVVKAGVASPSAIRRFEFEAQVLARLRHPGIAQVFDAGTWDDGSGAVPFFAMEYIPNAKSVTQYAIDNHLDVRERLELFEKVCDAVHHGHQRGIIHRDLKPDNILVDSSGQPKIIDFGVARATDSDMAVTTLQTNVGQIIGTLQYMSPEQCDADPNDLDTRTDVYALGVILFELLSNQLPYDIKQAAIHEAMRIIHEQAPVRLSAARAVLKGDIETIVQKALEKERSRRYQSAADLAQDIERFLHNEPIEARPASIIYQVRMFSKRHRVTVTSAAMIFLSIIAGLYGTTTQWIEATRQRDRAQDRAESIKGLAGQLLSDLYESIYKMEGMLEVRQEMAANALTTLENLQARTEDDPDIQQFIADKYVQMGDITGGIRSSSLGDRQGALAHYERAVSMRRSLAARSPGDPVLKIQLAAAIMKVGDIHKRRRAYEDVLEHYGEALRITRDVSGVEAERLASTLLMGLGDAHKKLGDLETALKAFDESMVLRERYLDANPSSEAGLRDFGNILLRIATNRNVPDEDYAGAETTYRRNLEIRESLLALDANSNTFRRDLAWAHYYVGWVLQTQERNDEVAGEYAQAVKYVTECVRRSPDDRRSRRDLLTLLDVLVRTRTSEGDGEAALPMCTEALAILEPLLQRDPENDSLQADAARIRTMIASVSK